MQEETAVLLRVGRIMALKNASLKEANNSFKFCCDGQTAQESPYHKLFDTPMWQYTDYWMA
jgi:hypothetical protein